MKKLTNKAILVISLIIIAILLILLFRYISLYNKARSPKFGYYINKDMQITNIDLQNHNLIYEKFGTGEYDYNYVLKLIEYIYSYNINNNENEYLHVNIMFNDKEYNLMEEEEFKRIYSQIENYSGEYFLSVNYNKATGAINSITITKKSNE